MIRAALFDLDGVIRRFDVAPLAALERQHGLPARTVLDALLRPARFEEAITGRLSDEAWRAAAAEEMGPAGPGFLAWEEAHGRVDAAVLAHVRAARARGPVGLLSNATSRLRADLRRLGLDAEFDVVVNTSEIGFAKPDPRAFLHAAQALGFAPPEILFVDDTPRNVEAAAALGFAAHRFTDPESLGAFLRATR